MSVIIGLDIAQTTTGMARLRPCPSGAITPLVEWSTVTASKGEGLYDDQERAGKTLSAIAKWSDIGATVPVGMLAVCEDYAFGVQMAGTRSVAMVTGLIRYWLWKHKVPFVLVSPQSLKKWIVGRASHKGDKIGKEIVNRELYARFGHSVDDNNAADAVGLAYIGAALQGIWTPQNEAQRDVLKKIKVEGKIRG